MKLYNLRISKKEQRVKVSVSIDSENLNSNELWFSTTEKYANYICTSRYDAFLVGLLYPAMKYGENIHIEGAVSKKLIFNINHYVIPLIKSFSPTSKKIKVTANELTSIKFNGDRVGTGFSGGIDSFCTIYDHYVLESDEEYKINTFLFLNVGSHGFNNEDKVFNKFNARYNHLKKFPEEIGLDFIPLDSNLYKFHPWGHQKTHTLTSVSGILVFQKIFKRYYYASSGINYDDMLKNAYKFREIDIGEYCDPIILPLLSTESTEIISDGIQYTRVEKTLRILNYEPVYRYLNVCVSGDDTHENCSVCSKCCRTLMTLNSIGRLEDFKNVFDIEKYRNIAEKKYISKQVLIQNKDLFAKYNVKLAKENNIRLPNRLYSYIINMPSLIFNQLLNVVKFILPESIKKGIKKKIGI